MPQKYGTKGYTNTKPCQCDSSGHLTESNGIPQHMCGLQEGCSRGSSTLACCFNFTPSSGANTLPCSGQLHTHPDAGPFLCLEAPICGSKLQHLRRASAGAAAVKPCCTVQGLPPCLSSKHLLLLSTQVMSLHANDACCDCQSFGVAQQLLSHH